MVKRKSSSKTGSLFDSHYEKLYSEEAERAVIGGIIFDNSAFAQAVRFVEESDFWKEAYKILFHCIRTLIQKSEATDLVTLMHQLELRGELESVGGITFIAGILDDHITSRNVVHYARIVREYSNKRKTFKTCYEIAQATLNGNDLNKLITNGLQTFESIRTSQSPNVEPQEWRTYDMAYVHSWQIEPLEWLIENAVARGNLVLVVGSSQTGKTLIMLHIARVLTTSGQLFGKLNTKAVNKVCYFVLEDPDWRIADRGVNDKAQLPRPGLFMVKIAPGFDLREQKTFTYLEELIQGEGFDMLVIDTYQRATPGINSFDDEKQSQIFHSLANLTRKTRITLFVLEHVRKGETGKKRNHLTIDDVKGSGVKVQNSDSIILLERRGNGELLWTSYSKDGRQLSFLIKVAPEESEDQKFTYIKDVDSLFGDRKSEGEQNRKKVLALLSPGGVKVESICKAVGLKKSAVQLHLNALKNQGLAILSGKGKNSRWFSDSESPGLSNNNRGQFKESSYEHDDKQ